VATLGMLLHSAIVPVATLHSAQLLSATTVHAMGLAAAALLLLAAAPFALPMARFLRPAR
jgi:hypothetical protein